jgi:hypothetical protein
MIIFLYGYKILSWIKEIILYKKRDISINVEINLLSNLKKDLQHI